MLKDEGKLDEALTINEDLYRTFEAAGARQQMATSLNEQAIIYSMKGRFDKAIAAGERSLELNRQRNDDGDQASSLQTLSVIHRQAEDYDAALACSQEAKVLAGRLGNEYFLAIIVHQQGLIYNDLAHAGPTERKPHCYREAAFGCFTEVWPSCGASGTRPARPTRWANWQATDGHGADARSD